MGAGPEFDHLRRLAAALGDAAAGWGDDAAILEWNGGPFLVASADLAIEEVHFRRAWLTLEEIGWRAAAAALSDLAACGAEPVAVLVSLGTSPALAAPALDELMGGIGAAARAAGTRIVGGDLSASDRLVIDCCVLGRAERPVRRRGAAPGEGVWVTGRLGGPGAAVGAWRAGREPDPVHRTRFARPEPRIAAGQWLAGRGATALIDVSDGLAADAGHLAAASGVRLILDLERLPLVEGIVDPVAAAASGEEYELLVALPAAFSEADAQASPTPLARIGVCDRGTGVELRQAGRAVVPPPGYDHFALR